MITLTQQPRISSEPSHYKVLYPDTGEVLAYVSLPADKFASPLAQALENNGFRLVPLYPDLSPSLVALHVS